MDTGSYLMKWWGEECACVIQKILCPGFTGVDRRAEPNLPHFSDAASASIRIYLLAGLQQHLYSGLGPCLVKLCLNEQQPFL